MINPEIYEKLKFQYIENCFGVCPHELDNDFVDYESEKCNITCEACRKQTINKIIEKD